MRGTFISKQLPQEAGRTAACADKGQSRDTVTIFCITAEARLSQYTDCHRLVAHSSLQPKRKRQMKARKRNRGTGESNDFPEVTQQRLGEHPQPRALLPPGSSRSSSDDGHFHQPREEDERRLAAACAKAR